MTTKMKKEMAIPVISKKNLSSISAFPAEGIGRGAANTLRRYGVGKDIKNLMVLLFLSYIRNEFRLSNSEELSAYIDKLSVEESIRATLNAFIEKYYEAVPYFASDWIPDEILSVIIENISWYRKSFGKSNVYTVTPKPIVELAIKLLKIDKKESALDTYALGGNFTVDAYLDTEAEKVTGIEFDEDAYIVSKLRALAMGNVLQIKQGNGITEKIAADKVFADIPLRIKDDMTDTWAPDDSRIAEIYENVPSLKRRGWTFVLSALSKQKVGGRTVVITSESLLFRASKGEQELRQYLVESGKLETVIALPQGGQAGPNITRVLFVFSQGNTSVKMVDARDCMKKERHHSEMTLANIEEVLRRVNEETKHSRSVSHEEIEGMGYNLSPFGYLDDQKITVENGEALENLVLSVERAPVIPAATLNKLATKEETNFQYLLLKDIEDDTINMPLPYLREFEDKWDKYCLSEGSLVISRSAPVKVAIVPPLHGKKVLSNGNMYSLLFDQTKIHPIYALCYLKSREGAQQLGSLMQGTAIPIISRKDLLRLRIPVISMEEQNAIVDKYLSIRRKINTIRRQERELESELAKLLEGTE